MGEAATLWTLFAGSFLAATLLPGGSEALLYALLAQYPGMRFPALATATVGNTLGGMTSYCIGRVLPAKAQAASAAGAGARALTYARRYGSPALLGAWIPFVGDPLCVAAGWLRLPWLPVLLYMAAGKLARYLFVSVFAG
jgi:membrane protein YqaA with SNARE-associated domain